MCPLGSVVRCSLLDREEQDGGWGWGRRLGCPPERSRWAPAVLGARVSMGRLRRMDVRAGALASEAWPGWLVRQVWEPDLAGVRG